MSTNATTAAIPLYEVIPSMVWRRDDGLTASVYGAVPWRSDGEKSRWQREQVGWTVRDNRRGTVGIGRKPWADRAEAEEWIRQQLKREGWTS